MSAGLELGVRASVVMEEETHGPARLHDEREGLRSVVVFPGGDGDHFSEAGHDALRAAKVDNMVLPLDSSDMEVPLVDEINIVSTYSLHVALYALQNPTPENIARALYKLGTSGDCEEHVDPDTLLPLPVDEPPGWAS